MAIDSQTNVSKLMNLINSYKDLQMSFVATYEQVDEFYNIRVVATYKRNVLSKGTNPNVHGENDIIIYQARDPQILDTVTQTFFIYPTAWQNVEYNVIFEYLLASFQKIIQDTSFD